MRLLLTAVLVTFAPLAFAQPRAVAKDSALKKQSSNAPDRALAGDISRKASEKSKAAPALSYDQFRLGVELQVAEKRRQQIQDLRKIIKLDANDAKQMPTLLFRLGELYWEESKYFFFEANRKDDDLIRAMNAKDEAGQEAARAAKAELLEQSKSFAKQATDLYSEIVQRYKDFPRTDEVLYFLGQNLMELGDDRRAVAAFKRLIERFPKSKFLPDAYLAFGEFYFNNSKGKREMLSQALEAYKKAAAYPESQVYGYALYKQGWCYFNLGDYQKAMDMYKAVVLYGEFAGVKAVEGESRKGSRAGLIREARADFVRAFSRSGGTPTEARVEFAKLAKSNDDRFTMLKQLANLYYEDGKDREAAVAFNMLIKDKPLSPEAPGFQGKIVDCVLRAGNKKMTVDQVRRLVKVIEEVQKANTAKDEKDKKALEEGRELAERMLSNLAVNWHNEAKKTRDDETFAFANEVYADYLALFAGNKKAYKLRFFWAELLNDNLQRYDKAAEQYTQVFLQDIDRAKRAAKGEVDADNAPIKPGEHFVGAGFNAIWAYDEWVKQLAEKGTLKPPQPPQDVKQKAAIAPPRKALLEACERYLTELPAAEKQVEVRFKAAKIYYDHNYLDEAILRFSEIALNYPDYKFENGDRAGEVAANLVLDSLNLLGDSARVNEWARKFYANEALATGKFKEELSKVMEQSSFKLVSQFEGAGDYSKAAEAYLNFVSEFPKSEIADQALFNAAIDFFKGKQLDKSIEMRQRLIRNYPKSKFVPQSLFDLAEGYEATAYFDKAAAYYESYVNSFLKGSGTRPAPKKGKKGKAAPSSSVTEQGFEEGKAQIALYNAGVFRDGLGQYRQALANREKYLGRWPNAKDSEAVFLSIIDLHEKYGAFAKAIKQLEEYERQYSRDPNKVLMAEGRIARIFEKKMKSEKNARRIYDRILKYHENLRGRARGLDILALDAVARAHFESNDDDFRRYRAMRLRWPSLKRVNDFRTSLQEKSKALEALQRQYTKTVSFKSADPAICALDRLGQAYDLMVNALENLSFPKDANEELLFEIKAQMAQQAQGPKDKASEAFLAAVSKSQELDIFNACTLHALRQLREKYRPEQFPQMPEMIAPLSGSLAAQAVGEGLLNEIQPIPTVSAEKAAQLREQGENLSKEVKSLEDVPPPMEESRRPGDADGLSGESLEEPAQE